LWSFLLLVILVQVKNEWAVVKSLRSAPRTTGVLVVAAVLLSMNWLLYIWAVNAGFIVETSLGYFINPLVNVLLGVVFLRERLRPFQWVPIALAAGGVLYMTISYGTPPWIALALAFSFGIYGLLKKRLPLGALPGLAAETAVMAPLALIFLSYLGLQGTGALFTTGSVSSLLLVLSGAATALPLLLFNAAVRRINLSTIGILQYMAPSMQFLIGVLIYGEVFDRARAIGFSMIWAALLLYSIESILVYRKTSAQKKLVPSR
jgi:chloramphenicol-sensitive protein RarD